MKVEKKLPSYLSNPNKGGLLIGFIYVIAFMSILFLWIWQVFETRHDRVYNFEWAICPSNKA